MATFLKNQRKKALKSGEPRPKGRGMVWEGLRTPPKLGFELPGPEGPGFWSLDEKF
jgi:hypothetical protein